MNKPALLFFCQHSLGMGHLVRALALARALAERFDVTLAAGGKVPADCVIPPGVRLHQLPPLAMETDAAGVNALTALDGTSTVAQLQSARREQLLHLLASTRPAAILIELFPFGRKKLAAELLPLVDAAHALGAQRPRILCSLRDILVSDRRDQHVHDERAAHTVNRWFDAVLVHTDPEFARLDETFAPHTPLEVPVLYTGFALAPRAAITPVARKSNLILVSAGGGSVGMPLYRAALAAHRILRERRFGTERLDMQIVAGPFLSEVEWQELRARGTGIDGLELVRALPNLADEFARATMTIGQCGYNSALETVACGVRALVVPYAEGREDEQRRRALRLAERGALRMLDPRELSGARLADEIELTLAFTPRPARLDLEGAQRTTKIVAAMVEASRATDPVHHQEAA